jgi:putative PIN family toxin of toxin-antitoxin system
VRVLLDTNVIVAGLLSPKGPPATLIRAWLDGWFKLVTAPEQLDELARVLTYKHLARLIDPAQARDFLDNVGVLAVLATGMPVVEASPDPADNVILAIAVAGRADLIVSGDKADMLSIGEVEGIPIISARSALERLGLTQQ